MLKSMVIAQQSFSFRAFVPALSLDSSQTYTGKYLFI